MTTPPNNLHQYSILNALMHGICETGPPLSTHLTHGTHGLGTVPSLNGEIIILANEAYHFPPSSTTPRKLSPTDPLPFLMITNFQPTFAHTHPTPLSMTSLPSALSPVLPSQQNRFIAVRVEGEFTRLVFRVIPAQETPREPLRELARRQVVRETSTIAMSELDPAKYTVAWIAPLEIEAQAAVHMLDHKHEGRFPLSRGDDYVFQAGDICSHNVVIATLPAGQEYGSGSASALASQIKKFFPNLWFGLLVGVAAGLPNLTRDPPIDIRLGDVLVGLSAGEDPGLVAYDLGKELGEDGFRPLRCGYVLASTETVVRSAIGSIKLHSPDDFKVILPFYEDIKNKRHSNGTFDDPGQVLDELYDWDDSGSTMTVMNREERPTTGRNRIWETRRTVWLVPFQRNPRFVGRENEISRLKADLFKQDRPKKMAVTGLGGVGKTQLAIELAYHIREEYPDCSVFWIPCMSSETVEQAYLAAREKLALPPIPDRSVKAQIKSHLGQESAGRWLLIYDNADDMEMWIGGDNETDPLKVYLPESLQGFVLFTTRNRKLAVKLASPEVVSIPQMNEETALHMLRASLIDTVPLDDDRAVGTLLHQLTFLPLAIAQAAAYVNENSLTIADYLNLLDEQEEDVIDLLSEDFEDDWRYSEIKNPVATTWLISFNQIRQLNKLAADYLSFMACIHAKEIPLSLLPAAPSSKKRAEALGLLTAYSFIDLHRESKLLNLHRLVHLATRTWLKKTSSFDYYLRKTCTQINKVFPGDDPENRPLWRTYLAHAQLTLDQGRRCDMVAHEREALLEKVGRCLLSDGRYNEAEPLFVELLGTIKKMPTDEGPDYFSCMALIASTYRSQGRWKEAESLEVEVLEKTINAFGIEHHRTTAAMDNLVLTYFKLGRWKDAQKLILQVLPIREKMLGATHPDTASTMARLASSYWNMGQLLEAERLEEQVLEIRSEVLGIEHPDTLEIMAERASSHSNQGRWQEAEALQKHVLGIQKRVMGPKHPATLTTMADLASTFRRQERWEESETLDVEVLEAREAVFGHDHPDTLTTMSNLAYTYWGQGHLEKAERTELQILETYTKVLGTSHPKTLTAMDNLASTYISQGQTTEAEGLQKQALEIQMRELGAEHPDTLNTMGNLATTYYNQQRWELAEKLETRVLDIARRVFGPEHPRTFIIMDNLLCTYIDQSKWQMAEELATQLLKIQSQALGPTHSDTQTTLTKLISIARGQERWKEVERLEIIVLESRMRNLGSKLPN
ncbi:hypothetical protein FE257_010347 [Aspergillus nanangensis]|uniref:NB-ARC domain-containing protein n=1 Tax=Aspergillus nanangensis TaxID=2582783 RepID=A0AAD4GS74_ASPNN|nr:hypothetical protein FE257_010347 [Aspergillus nanangensis]